MTGSNSSAKGMPEFSKASNPFVLTFSSLESFPRSPLRCHLFVKAASYSFPISLAMSSGAHPVVFSYIFAITFFRYPLTPVPKPQPETDVKRDLLISHDNPSDGHLILGHTSLLTSFCLPSDEKYIITADRDEHIRVSWYPQGYCIENYCLGHEK